MSIHVGINGGAKNVIESYVGINGSAKSVVEAYIYENGTAKSIYKKRGQIAITESGIFTVPKGVSKIDVFMVGAGGGGGYSLSKVNGAGGGGGGYTKTIKGLSVLPGQEIQVTIGVCAAGKDGGDTIFGEYTVGGGKAGDYIKGGDGGSGGAGIGMIHTTYTEVYNAGDDGSDGEDTREDRRIAHGQGSTTRAFGELGGAIYAGGGGSASLISIPEQEDIETIGRPGTGGGKGGISYVGHAYTYRIIGEDGSHNTGGGGGGCVYAADDYRYGATKGGSGLVLVRWGY